MIALNSLMSAKTETSASNGVSGELSGVGRVRLRTIETNLLQALSSNIGKPMSREELCRRVWKCEFRGTTRTIDQTVATLRKKLLATQRIVTVHCVGYSYVEANTAYNHASPPTARGTNAETANNCVCIGNNSTQQSTRPSGRDAERGSLGQVRRSRWLRFPG